MCSVIVPCFNAQATVAAAVASALASPAVTEVICVDDGSTDTTAAILAGIAEHEPRLVVVTQANAGVAVARNRGIAAARCAVIALLDSDDIWHPGHVEVHIARLAADARLGVSFSTARFRMSGPKCRMRPMPCSLATAFHGAPTQKQSTCPLAKLSTM